MKTIAVYEPGDRVLLRIDWQGWRRGDFAEVVAVHWSIADFEPAQTVLLRGAGKAWTEWFDAKNVEPDQEPRP